MKYEHVMIGVWLFNCGCVAERGRDGGPGQQGSMGILSTVGSGGADSSGGGETPTSGVTGGTTSGRPTTGGSETTGAVEPGSSSGEVDPSTGMDAPGSTLGTTRSDEDEPACGGVIVEAHPKLAPVDIVIAVDNSGSMSSENNEVQKNLNAFADQLVASGIDFQLFLISQYPAGNPIGICVDPPLGNGGCPASDSKPPFLHIDREVYSNSALDDIMATAEIWYPKLRTDALKVLMVASDDDAVKNAADADEKAEWFHSGLMDDYTGFQGQYSFHAIAGIAGQTCAQIARVGTTYAYLVKPVKGERTQGVLADLCNQNFDPIFEQLSQSIVNGAELPCDIQLPAPQMGEEFDPDKINVLLSIAEMPPTQLLRVDGPGACASAPNEMGWYYDVPEAPTRIILCDKPCQKGQQDGSALALELGCKTLVPG